MKSAEILRPLTFARNYATIACRKSNLRRGQYGGKKQCAKAAVQYTFCDGKVSVKVRTEIEKMWYNMFGGKAGNIKNSGNYCFEKRKKSFLIVKRGEILSNLLTVFCKGL